MPDLLAAPGGISPPSKSTQPALPLQVDKNTIANPPQSKLPAGSLVINDFAGILLIVLIRSIKS